MADYPQSVVAVAGTKATAAARNLLRDDTIEVEPSDDLRNSNNAAKTTNSLTYVKLKEIKLDSDFKLGTVRVKFDIGISDAGTAYGKVYRNGGAIGSEQSRAGGYKTKSEDLACAGWVINDLIQLYVKHTDDVGDAECKNFRLYYAPACVRATTNQDP